MSAPTGSWREHDLAVVVFVTTGFIPAVTVIMHYTRPSPDIKSRCKE